MQASVGYDDSETDRVALDSGIPPLRGGFGCLVVAAIKWVLQGDRKSKDEVVNTG